VDLRRFSSISVDFRGFASISVDFRGFASISVDFRGFASISVGLGWIRCGLLDRFLWLSSMVLAAGIIGPFRRPYPMRLLVIFGSVFYKVHDTDMGGRLFVCTIHASSFWTLQSDTQQLSTHHRSRIQDVRDLGLGLQPR
jgi:hypothetical protein